MMLSQAINLYNGLALVASQWLMHGQSAHAIVNGFAPGYYEHPYSVFIKTPCTEEDIENGYCTELNKDDWVVSCAAALIRPDVIVTAASCFSKSGITHVGQFRVGIYINEPYRLPGGENEHDDVNITRAKEYPCSAYVRITNVLIHSAYQPNSGSDSGNIALAKLARTSSCVNKEPAMKTMFRFDDKNLAIGLDGLDGKASLLQDLSPDYDDRNQDAKTKAYTMGWGSVFDHEVGKYTCPVPGSYPLEMMVSKVKLLGCDNNPAYPPSGFSTPTGPGEFNSLAQRMYLASTSIEHPEVCAAAINDVPEVSYYNEHECVCTQADAGDGYRGIGHRDEGSPLVIGRTLVGVASRIIRCDVKAPAIYTRVSTFASWIQQHADHLDASTHLHKVKKPPQRQPSHVSSISMTGHNAHVACAFTLTWFYVLAR